MFFHLSHIIYLFHLLFMLVFIIYNYTLLTKNNPQNVSLPYMNFIFTRFVYIIICIISFYNTINIHYIYKYCFPHLYVTFFLHNISNILLFYSLLFHSYLSINITIHAVSTINIIIYGDLIITMFITPHSTIHILFHYIVCFSTNLAIIVTNIHILMTHLKFSLFCLNIHLYLKIYVFLLYQLTRFSVKK